MIEGLERRALLAHSRSLAFRERVERARALIMANLHDKAYVSISGGKDASVIAHMAHEIMPGVQMISWMDDLEWPETRAILETFRSHLGWNIRVVWQDGLFERMVRIGKSPFEYNYFYEPSMVSSKVEAKSFSTYLMGLRAEESKARQRNAQMRGVQYIVRGKTAVCPLQWWKAQDVFAYHVAHDIPMHPLYFKRRFHEMEPGRLRVSWWIPSPAVAGHGYCVWLRYYHPALFAKLLRAFPEVGAYG